MPVKSICATDGPLLHDHHQHVAVALQAHVAEEAGGEQRADRLRRPLVGHGVADLDRQVAEDGAGFGALDAFDPDVLDDERLERRGRDCMKEDEQRGKSKPGHESAGE